MKRLIVVLALSAFTLALSGCTPSAQVAAPAPPVPPAPQAPGAASLSDGAAKIVAALRSRPDIDRICGGGEAFRGAMRVAVIDLVMAGAIDNPRADAESAADFLHAHCGQREAAAPASAVGPNVSSGSR